MKKKVIIIGSGFSSLSAACYLAKQGHEVTIFEKNPTIGGRARQLKIDGFTFDLGPTFYWMPDVFEKFFADFGTAPSDYYNLIRLDPSYRIYFGDNKSLRVSGRLKEVENMFEKNEPGSRVKLEELLTKARSNYELAMGKLIEKPGDSPFEIINFETIKKLPQIISSLEYNVRKNFKNPFLRQILEFPVLFLGAKPSDVPYFYNFMNYADMVLGTWHIEGGIFRLVDAMADIAQKFGTKIYCGKSIEKINVGNGKARGVVAGGEEYTADVIISGADYHHTETLMSEEYRNYSENYWNGRVMSPSAILYYIGFNKKLENISHHTFFFDADFSVHAQKIYDEPGWPENPLFYASFPSVSDKQLVPDGKEAAIILIPYAAGISDTEEIREFYFNQVIERMEIHTNQSLKDNILFCKTYAGSDFMHDYNAYKGNAYGLSNILTQTAFFKPKMRNRKIPNLFYSGQLTVPGPGIPTTLISGKIAAGLASSYLETEFSYS